MNKYMTVLAWVVLVAAVAAENVEVGVGRSDVGIVQPLYINYTQGVAELLLLRQEFLLKDVLAVGREQLGALDNLTTTLEEIRSTLTSKGTLGEGGCPPGYQLVAGRCLLLAFGERLGWAAARHYCVSRHADLATIADANDFAATIAYVYSINRGNEAVSVWLGGSDEVVEGAWTWVTGDLMPMGSPYWGTTNNYAKEPNGEKNQNCAMMYQPDFYYLHSNICSVIAAPLCQVALA